jgi:hypothetical protein
VKLASCSLLISIHDRIFVIKVLSIWLSIHQISWAIHLYMLWMPLLGAPTGGVTRRHLQLRQLRRSVGSDSRWSGCYPDLDLLASGKFINQLVHCDRYAGIELLRFGASSIGESDSYLPICHCFPFPRSVKLTQFLANRKNLSLALVRNISIICINWVLILCSNIISIFYINEDTFVKVHQMYLENWSFFIWKKILLYAVYLRLTAFSWMLIL